MIIAASSTQPQLLPSGALVMKNIWEQRKINFLCLLYAALFFASQKEK